MEHDACVRRCAESAGGDVNEREVIVLPAELLPVDWPADRLRTAYRDFAAQLVALRDATRLVEVR